MSGVEVLVPWLLVSALFIALRRLEGWLHQHIFKVGWLITKDMQTTTILYYAFFLPGVILHEIVLWLAAGLLNVRADRQIQWPQAQEIGQLDLNFVRLDKKANPFRLAIIHLFPLVVGIGVVWAIANYILDVPSILVAIGPGTLPDVVRGLRLLLQTPDFWLWFFVAFTVSNTMMPEINMLRGMRSLFVVGIVAAVILVLLGVGGPVIVGFLGGPVTTLLNVLAGTFAVIIALDLVGVGVLSAVENTIELITGDSADFRNGKMITMTRQERLSARAKAIDKQRQRRERRQAAQVISEGPPSIYRIPLPVPGSPPEVEVTLLQKMISEEKKRPELNREARAGASQIEGGVEEDAQRNIRSGSRTLQLNAPSSESSTSD